MSLNTKRTCDSCGTDLIDSGSEVRYLSTEAARRSGDYCSVACLLDARTEVGLSAFTDEQGPWLEDRVPEAGPHDQAGHTVTEAAELLDTYVKEEQYGEEPDERHRMTELGDVIVSAVSHAALEGWDAARCVALARGKNDDPDSDGGPPESAADAGGDDA